MWLFFFSSRRRHTRLQGDWSSDVCSSDLDRMRVSYHNQIGFVPFQQLTPRRSPKKNCQLQRIGFVWSNRNCGTGLLACLSARLGRAGARPPLRLPATSGIGFVSSNASRSSFQPKEESPVTEN